MHWFFRRSRAWPGCAMPRGTRDAGRRGLVGEPWVPPRVGPPEALAAPDRAGLSGRAGAGPFRRVPLAGLARSAALLAYVLYAWQQSDNFESVLSLAAIWSVATVGLGLVLGAAGQISLCQASFVLVGAYVYGTIALTESGPTLLGLGAAALGGAAAALLVSPVLRADR